jgi:hypothetical protein
VLESNELVLEKIYTSENGSDMLTTPISPLKLEVCCEKAGLVGRYAL